MKPPLPNLLMTLAGALLLFAGLGVHPSLILLALGAVLCLIGMTVRFEKPANRRRRRDL